MVTQQQHLICLSYDDDDDGGDGNELMMNRMEVASSRPDHLPTLSAPKSSARSLLIKSRFWWRSGRCRHGCSDFLLQCVGDIEADHTDSGIVMDCAD